MGSQWGSGDAEASERDGKAGDVGCNVGNKTAAGGTEEEWEDAEQVGVPTFAAGEGVDGGDGEEDGVIAGVHVPPHVEAQPGAAGAVERSAAQSGVPDETWQQYQSGPTQSSLPDETWQQYNAISESGLPDETWLQYNAGAISAN